MKTKIWTFGLILSALQISGCSSMLGKMSRTHDEMGNQVICWSPSRHLDALAGYTATTVEHVQRYAESR